MNDRRRRPERRDVRGEALEILLRVERSGAYAGVLLEQRETGFEDPRDAALLHEIVLGVLRRRAVLDHVIGRVASRSLDRIDPPVRVVLRIGAYAILDLDRVPEFAAVDTAVELVKRGGDRASASFVNAVLRRIAREGASLLPPEPRRGDVAGLALALSHPGWWVDRLVRRLGWDRAVTVLEADNRPAATTLRTRTGRTSSQDLAVRLAREAIVTEPGRYVPDTLRVVVGVPQRTEAFRAGLFWIQDEASALVPTLFGDTVGPRVLDACAAPGGKTMNLAERLVPGGFVVAADRHPGRLRRLARNLERVGLGRSVMPVAADLSAGKAIGGRFDDVLVDAPCSATGTMRRHPEIRWRLRPQDLERLADRQLRLLQAAADRVGAGGRLVYSVCSMEPEEGEQVVERFRAARPEFAVADLSGVLPEALGGFVGEDGAVRTTPADGEIDGFFAVRLDRVPR